MSPRRTAGALLAVAFAVIGLMVTPTAVPAAQAVTGSPPVTVPDAVTMFPGGFAEVEPAANDQDPDGDRLAVCRLGDEHYRGIEIEAFRGHVALLARGGAKPGVYTFTYLACDYSYLVPGTITVTIEKAPHIGVHKISGRPGRIRVTNPADFPIRFLYGSPKAQRPDGNVRIAAHHSKVISVDRPSIIWVAITLDPPSLVDRGHVSGLQPGRGDSGRTARFTSREALAWLAG